ILLRLRISGGLKRKKPDAGGGASGFKLDRQLGGGGDCRSVSNDTGRRSASFDDRYIGGPSNLAKSSTALQQCKRCNAPFQHASQLADTCLPLAAPAPLWHLREDI